MTEIENLKRTPFYDCHVAAKGRMTPFAGWIMPVQYSGVAAEHAAVRESVGLFDVSHMGEFLISGPDALANVERLTCNNVSKLKPGRVHYSAMLYPQGTFVDDLLVYCKGPEEYLLVVNAANLDKDFEWVNRHCEGDVSAVNISDSTAQLALQGPKAVALLQSVYPDLKLPTKPFRFMEAETDAGMTLISRTGYTGEDGFELYWNVRSGPGLWDILMKAGESSGIKPIGLGARDTLRFEACLSLYGNDIGDTTTPFEANLAWIVKMSKGDFIGRDALSAQLESGVEQSLVGFEMIGRGIPRHGYAISVNGRDVGHVTSGTMTPYLKKALGLGYVPAGISKAGTELGIVIRGKTAPAKIVETPFYKRGDQG